MKKIFLIFLIAVLPLFSFASEDTCHIYQISAVQIYDGNPRIVYLIFDKDSSWHLSYEPIKKESEIFNEPIIKKPHAKN